MKSNKTIILLLIWFCCGAVSKSESTEKDTITEIEIERFNAKMRIRALYYQAVNIHSKSKQGLDVSDYKNQLVRDFIAIWDLAEKGVQ